MLALRRDGERITFTIRVTPRASANAVAGERDGALLVRVSAPPSAAPPVPPVSAMVMVTAESVTTSPRSSCSITKTAGLIGVPALTLEG